MTWKRSAIYVRREKLHLSNGLRQESVTLPLPPDYQEAELRQAEFRWRADHYELALALDTGEVPRPLREEGQVAGVDLGEVHVAAVVSEEGKGVVLSVHPRIKNRRTSEPC